MLKRSVVGIAKTGGTQDAGSHKPKKDAYGEVSRESTGERTALSDDVEDHAQGTSRFDEGDTRDVKIIVDWNADPDLELAKAHRMLTRPMYKLIDGRRIPLDPADATLTEKGFRMVPIDVKHPEHPTTRCPVAPYPIWGTTVEELGTIGGAGLRIYFSLLHLIAIAFLAMALLMTPALLVAGLGFGSPTDTSSDSMYNHVEAATYRDRPFLRWSLGNVRSSGKASEGDVGALWLFSWLDVACSVMLFCLILVMNKKRGQVEQAADLAMVSMSDYSVRVKPMDTKLCWEQYPKRRKDEFVLALKNYLETTICDERGTYVRVAEVVQDGVRQPAIWPGFDEDENITLWRQKMLKLYALEAAIGKAVRTRDTNVLLKDGGPVALLEDLNANLQQVAEDFEFKTICAYVTFELDRDYETALEWGAQLDLMLEERKGGKKALLAEAFSRQAQAAARQPASADQSEPSAEDSAEDAALTPYSSTQPAAGSNPLAKDPRAGAGGGGLASSEPEYAHFHYDLFEGNMIRVKPADEPEVIQWDHLEYTGASQALRKLAVHSVTALLLGLGFFLIIYAAGQRDKYEFLTACDEFTDKPYLEGAFALKYKSTGVYCDGLFVNSSKMDMQGTPQLLREAERVDNVTSFYHRAYSTTLASGAKPSDSIAKDGTCKSKWACPKDGSGGDTSAPCGCCADDVSDWSAAKATNGGAGCLRVDNRRHLGETSAFVNGASRDSVCFMCFCQEAASGEVGEEPQCDEFEEQVRSNKMWALVSSLIVVGTNQIVKFLLEVLVKFEKEHTVSSQNASLATKVFVAQTLNTAVLALLLKWDISATLNELMPGNKYRDANGAMIAKVVQPIVQTMVIQFLTAPLMHVIKWFGFDCVLRPLLRRTASTQNALNKIYTDQVIIISSSYAEVLVGVYVTLVYSTAMPIFLWIAAGGFMLKFWGDKWAVLRFYKKPPLYGPQLFDNVDEFMFLGLTLHAVSSTYFLSMAGASSPNHYVSPAGAALRDKLQPHAYPPAVVACICVSTCVLTLLYRAIFEWTACGRGNRHHLVRAGRRLYLDRVGKYGRQKLDEVTQATEDVLRRTESAAQRMGSVAGGMAGSMRMGGLFGDQVHTTGHQEEDAERVRLHLAAGGKGEDLQPFSVALEAGLIVNEDDDYYMDELENLRELELAVLHEVSTAFRRREYPFDDKEVAERVFNAAKSPTEDAEQVIDSYHGDVNAKHGEARAVDEGSDRDRGRGADARA